MMQIPQSIVDSFMELGLFESEAKIYTAIVLLRQAGVKDIRNSIGLSKPVIYTGLRSLEDRGMIMLTNQKPATYHAMPPPVALDVLMTTHQYHKEKALRLLENLENEFYQDNPPDSLWYTLDRENVEVKIKDMLQDAKEKVLCFTPGKYLDVLESNARRNLGFQIVVMSKDRAIQDRLERVFKVRTSIHTVRKSHIINFFAALNAGDREDKKQSLLEEMNMLDVDNSFILVVDDSECLAIPMSMSSSPRSVIATKNKTMIQNIKLMARMLMASEAMR